MISENESPAEGAVVEGGGQGTMQQVPPAAFDALGIGIAILDGDMRVRMVNGWVRDNVPWMRTGTFCYESRGSLSGPCPRCPAAESLKTGEVVAGVYAEGLPEGKEYIRMIASPFEIAGSSPGVILAYIDESEALEAQKGILQEARFRMSILNSAVYGIVVTDNEGRIIFVNPAVERMTGFQSHELMGRVPPYPFWPEDFADKYQNLLDRLREGASGDREIVMVRKDGARIDVRGTFDVVKDERNEPQGLMAVLTEVTELKQMERYLKLLSSAVESSAHAMCISDLEGKIIFVNRAQCEMSGYSREELTGAPVSIFMGKEEVSEDERGVFSEIMDTGHWTGRLVNVRKDGTRFMVRLISYLVRDDEGNPVAMASTALDIDDVVRREQEIMEKNLDLELFAHAISHDFRNPLVTIGGFAKLLDERLGDDLDDDQREWLQRIISNYELLDEMIDDLLIIPGAAVGEESQPVESADVLDDVLSTLELRIREKGAKVEAVGKLPRVKARRASLTRVLTNLVSNGLAFDRPGVSPRVEIGAKRADDYWEFYVSDNGRGLREEEKERVFAPFESGEDSAGAGIGMTIVKRAVEAMGGEIRLDSELGEGTTVYFTVPAAD